jgi:hypothetical protein
MQKNLGKARSCGIVQLMCKINLRGGARRALTAFLLTASLIPACAEGAASAASAPSVAAIVVERYNGEKRSASIRLYDVGDPARLAWREYPESFFCFPTPLSDYDKLYYWQDGSLLAIHKSGNLINESPVSFFRLDADLGLVPIGRLDSSFFNPEMAAFTRRAYEKLGWEVPKLEGNAAWKPGSIDLGFIDGDIFIHGFTVLHLGTAAIMDMEFIIRARADGPTGFHVIEAYRPTDPSPPLPASADKTHFIGWDTGNWEILRREGFDFSAAAPIIQNAEARLNPQHSYEPPCFYKYRGGVFFTYGRQGQNPATFDPRANRSYPRAHSFDVYWDKMIESGKVLIVQPTYGDGSIQTYDISVPTKLVSLKKYDPRSVQYIDLNAARLFGDILVGINRKGYVTRLRIGQDGSLVPLHTERELLEAIDRDDAAAVIALADYQIDAVSWSEEAGGDLFVVHAIKRRAYKALRALVEVEKRHGTSFEQESEGAINPLAEAVACRDTKALSILAMAFPALVDRSTGRTDIAARYPLTVAVEGDDRSVVVALLDFGARLDISSFRDGFPANALTYARSEGMKKLLISRGVAEAIVPAGPLDAKAVEDGNRLRASPSIDAAVLGQTMKGEAVKVLAIGAESVSIAGRTSRWLKIRTASGLEGWSFGAFYRIPAYEDW